MTTYIQKYSVGKKLEAQLLDYLNTTQPFKYYNTFNNTDLPICPYYPSLYRYSHFDIYNEYLTIELKSRSIPFNAQNTNILDTNKIINNHSIFCYTYNNQSEILTDLHFIPYTKSIFETFYIQTTKNNDNVYVIPSHELTKLNTITTHTHQININYTEDYKDKLTDLIATDRTNYISTFGFYNF
jgi:hypothetical protein